MHPWIIVGKDPSPDGGELVLARRDTEWEVRVGRETLMSSRAHGSEAELARLAFQAAPTARRLLVGGLGLGYSLRAVLDLAPEGGSVEVAELSSALVTWNREHVGALASHPLDDRRVRVSIGDVYDRIATAAPDALDAILLDVDNGPEPLVSASNARLYAPQGIAHCRAALRVGGVLAVWSAAPDEAYGRRLCEGGFETRSHRVRARAGGRRRHVVFVAVKR
jgi:spermidine synthase